MNDKEVEAKYTRMSRMYNIFEFFPENIMFKRWRRRVLQQPQGKVLEIGVGTGKNLPYYDYSKVDLTAIDISPGMLWYAENLAEKNNYRVKLKLASAKKLPFKDNTFDYIVCTFVLCSVPDPVEALKEMKRVLKKYGKIILLEHVLSKNKVFSTIENLLNPLTTRMMGVHINRNTPENIKKSGLKLVKEKDLAMIDIFKEMEAIQ